MGFRQKIFSYLSVFILCLAFFLSNSAQVPAAEFSTSDDGNFLYMDTRQLNVRYDNEPLKFVLQKDGTLRLMSRDGKHDYMSFVNYVGAKGGVGYKIRTICTTDPDMTFFEINADVGAHAMNCGYWLIGKHDGQWVTYVSLDSLATMGYTIGEWHQIRTKIDEDGTGRFILISSHEYLPPGAQYQYQRKHAVDLQLELFWDENAQWFGMRNL